MSKDRNGFFKSYSAASTVPYRLQTSHTIRKRYKGEKVSED